VERLIERGADVNIASSLGNYSPLLVARLSEMTMLSEGLFTSLLSHGASITHKNKSSQSAFDIVLCNNAKEKNTVAIKELLEYAITAYYKKNSNAHSVQVLAYLKTLMLEETHKALQNDINKVISTVAVKLQALEEPIQQEDIAVAEQVQSSSNFEPGDAEDGSYRY